MNSVSFERTIVEYLKRLGVEEQRRVLEFARALSTSKLSGVAGEPLLSFGGSIDKKDLDLMQEVIEEGCEKVVADEW